MFDNWAWKLLSLVAAALLWVAVASEPEMATIIRAPVVYKDAPQNLEISSAIESTVRLQVTGVSGRLREFTSAPSPVVLDLSGVHNPGERTFGIDSSNVRLPRGIAFVSSTPSQLRFTFEDRIRKDVPVHVQWSGKLRAGELIEPSEPDPPTLTIVGPASHVNAVQFVSTDPLDLGRVHDGDVLTTSPFIEEPLVRFQHYQPVRIKVILKD